MDCEDFVYSVHAVNRMFERDLTEQEIDAVVRMGEIIESYPDDQPLPSFLLLGRVVDRVVHVVLARDVKTRRCYVITAYEPDLARWEHDFKARRKP